MRKKPKIQKKPMQRKKQKSKIAKKPKNPKFLRNENSEKY